jgi:4'-phosphopantetheinyl transferase
LHSLNQPRTTNLRLAPTAHYALPFLKQVTQLNTSNLAQDVQVWQVELETDFERPLQDQEKLHQLLLLLTVTERDRCLRYRRPPDRIRFAIMRIVLRSLLAQHLQLPSAHIRLATGPFGKPYLAIPDSKLQFNISHSEHFGLIAFSDQRAVGVDIEAVYPLMDQRFLLKEILSSEEQQYCANSQDDSAFFKCWTAKEAVVKALGTGIQQPLSTISMLPVADFGYQVSLDQHLPTLQAWQLPVAVGYVASLALL